MQQLSVREITENDIEHIILYWLTASNDYLISLGVDVQKMPGTAQWQQMLAAQISAPYPYKQSYCTIWELNGRPIGHCNVNKIVFGQEAYMHLHIWNATERKMGLGVSLIQQSLPYFFNNLQIKKLYCEPYALNEAPNKTLAKAGFCFVKEYTTTPGSLNFEQRVRLWVCTVVDDKN